MNYSLSDCVKGEVVFMFFRDNTLFYLCENGFLFGVPIDDTSGGTFSQRDKGIYFMRWIRKALNGIKNMEKVS